MKVVIDVLGAPGRSGGMRLYAEELIRAWRVSHPEDTLTVVGYSWTRQVLRPYADIAVVVLPERAMARVAGQWVIAGLIARLWSADALISVSSVVSPVMASHRRFCVVHDWRHLANATEFPLAQRVYRRAWEWSIAHAGAAIQISAKTMRETRNQVPTAFPVIIENGRDHPQRWVVRPRPLHEGALATVVTFGHHTNKRPELVLGAIALLAHPPILVVLGAAGDHAARLRAVSERQGVSNRLRLPGFVSQSEYERVISESDVVVLASSDEGFGLPVAEAAYFGIPCVVTADSGLSEIHGDLVVEAPPRPEDLAGAISAALIAGPAVRAKSVRSWRDTSSEMRALIIDRVAQSS